MRLDLYFRSGGIAGGGSDGVGPFTVPNGSYSSDGEVTFSKRYASHLVLYSGRWDGAMISGTWTIRKLQKGGFEIWPEGSIAAINEVFAEELEPEPAGSTMGIPGPPGALPRLSRR